MYEKIVDLMPRAIFAAILGSIGAVGFIFCLGPAWSFNIQRLMRLQAMMLKYRSAVLMHQRVNKVPAAVRGQLSWNGVITEWALSEEATGIPLWFTIIGFGH